MDRHAPISVPTPRAPAEAGDSALTNIVQFRHRIALALARKYISPPGRLAVSARTGSLLDAAPH